MHSLHELHLSHASMLAILVSALILWFLGAAWYSPALFGMISSLIGDIILAFVLWHMVTWAEAITWGNGAFIGFLCWLGFIAAPAFPQGIYERRPTKLFLINTGYWLVGMVIVGAVLAVWR